MLASLLAACATYTARLADLRPQLARGDHELALATLEKGTRGKDILLAWLEQGLILRQAGRYGHSNAAFAAAERTADELYARSLSEGALSLITNDLAISYRARPFELGMVSYYRALNYLDLGDRQSAMVEARKTSHMLARHVDATVAGIERGPTSDLVRTRNDPFMLYFAGMLYDWDGDLNDAFIAYRNAATAYEDLHSLLGLQIPGWLGQDLERTGRRLGFSDELIQLREACPAVFAAAAALSCGQAAAAAEPGSPLTSGPGQGDVVLLLEAGFVPIKREVKLHFPILASDAYQDHAAWAWDLAARAGGAYGQIDAAKIRYWLSVAVPSLQSDPPLIGRFVARSSSGAGAPSCRVHNAAAVAEITFEAERPMILFKTVLRGLSKYLTTGQARKQGQVFGILANIFGAVTETADTRSWLTLPGEIHMVRLRLPEGTHDLRLEWEDGRGRVLGKADIPDVVVRRGDWTFIGSRVF